jgi:hypothetical protein
VNLKLQANEVRVRLSRGEAERLAAGEGIREEVSLPGGALAWRVDPSGTATGLALDRGAIVVTVAAAEVRALLEAPPSKDLGLHATAGGVAVVIEIDLWSGKKRA